MDDSISRQAAIDALNEQIEQCNKALGSFDISLKDEFAIKVERASLKAYREQLENLPPVQPKGTKLSTMCLLCKKPAVTFNTEDDIPYTNYSYCEDCLRKGLKLLKKQIKALPPVQPKYGKWHIENNSYVVLDVCDQCMRSVRHVAPFYDYCPHCGADMRGEAE